MVPSSRAWNGAPNARRRGSAAVLALRAAGERAAQALAFGQRGAPTGEVRWGADARVSTLDVGCEGGEEAAGRRVGGVRCGNVESTSEADAAWERDATTERGG